MGIKLTYEQVKDFVEHNSDSKLLSTQYISSTEKMLFQCACGSEFSTRFATFRRGKRKCFACGSKSQYESKRLPFEEFVNRLQTHDCTYLSGDYKNQKSKIKMLGTCGHEFETAAGRVSESGFNGLCSKCNRHNARLYTIEDVAKMCLDKGVELLSTEYTDSHERMWFRCSCGEKFSASWNNVQGGQNRCRKCTNKVTKGEQAVSDWLDMNGFNYQTEYKFSDCAGRKPYPFDFYLPEQNTCIEFDGEQHFRPVAFGGSHDDFEALKARDAAKDAYCESKNIRLIRIPYTQLRNVPAILNDMLIPR